MKMGAVAEVWMKKIWTKTTRKAVGVLGLLRKGPPRDSLKPSLPGAVVVWQLGLGPLGRGGAGVAVVQAATPGSCNCSKKSWLKR